MNYYEIEPVDNLFFRDGRPYNMGETQNDVKSMFPPTPYTMVGALRAAMARKMHWTEGPWDQAIISKLGNGEDLGPLCFSGPFVQANGKLVFPVPRNVLAQKDGKDTWKTFRKLRPGTEIQSDIGTIEFPALEEDLDKMRNIHGFISSSDLEKVLWGGISDIKPIPAENVWKHEFNVGIQRDEDTLTVPEGGLFSRSMVRLGKDVKLVSGIDGIDEDLDGPLMLGGESKAAFIQKINSLELPKPPADVGELRKFLAVLITPAYLDGLKPGGWIKGLDGAKLVSVCADRPQMIGGWDFQKGPLPLRPHLRAGSVLFCRSDEGIDPCKLNGSKIGENTKFGFGQVLIGEW